MKKTAFILLILITFLIITGFALARDRRPYHHRPPDHSGIYIRPRGIWISPPVYYRSYYPPYRAYPSYGYGYRVWVPGYWEERWTPYGWESVWVPGYWRYEY
jgi:hypothetical protein